ncbi:ATP-binding protein [Aromatoleum bremense]|uniref:histidine kinase n=1 Tax=Aromatoleum bremense TaxID=76115 RepID=A0ABX1NXC1_9RHOO|nr:ATP-binding protein [Aromatoleum bremense]NMG16669.1 HAMP domain-containing protein [Aromatoleum bremense]QTQ33817.1 Histidine kinase/HSP90-like ATPase domain-containing protein [Aromatoleum bremense]
MARRLSIRQRLTLHALLTGFVMLCLSLVFLSSQWHESRAEKRIFDSELAPAAALRDVERVLLTAHSRMQSVLLGHITAMAAQEQLVRARALIFSGWQDYRRQLSNWSQDPDETRLIENIENRLPELQRFLEQTDAAYRRDDHAELERLVNADWMALENSFSSAVANLSALQNHHVVRAREELAQSRQRSRLLFGTLLFAGVLLLSGFATGLSRYIMRRILNIEAALEEVAAGKAGTVPHHDGETEMSHIAHAINRTVADLTSNHDAIAELMHTRQTILASVAQLKETNAQLGEAQSQLLQTEKLAGLGQLAGGIAHEINNPIGFIHSNLGTLDNYLKDLFELISGYEGLIHRGLDARGQVEAAYLRERADYDFLREDMTKLVIETRDGVRRVARIVADLKDFSRIDSGEDWTDADLLHGLESTLNVVHAAIAGKADLIRDDHPLPAVHCHPGQINQVFMNLLLNAADAIETRGTITLRTRQHGDEVCVEVHDTGRGMNTQERERMFDPFFTTKPVGKGTGLGLSVSHSIVQRHGGRFDVDSEPGRGTAVRLWLPVSGRRRVAGRRSGRSAAVLIAESGCSGEAQKTSRVLS